MNGKVQERVSGTEVIIGGDLVVSQGGDLPYNYEVDHYKVSCFTSTGIVHGKYRDLKDLIGAIKNPRNCVVVVPVFKEGKLPEKTQEIHRAIEKSLRSEIRKSREIEDRGSAKDQDMGSNYLLIPHDGSSVKVYSRERLVKFLEEICPKAIEGAFFDLISPIFLPLEQKDDEIEEAIAIGI